MLGFFLRCIGCGQPFLQGARALCSLCESSLLRSPPLCSQCGSPVCPSQFNQLCSRPWVSQMRRERGGIHSYSARYLMVAQSYLVLKKWKSHRGPLFDRQVLVLDPALIAIWKSFGADAVVPMPQSFFRSWKRRGSRTEVIARWVGGSVSLPLMNLLEMKISPMSKPQGERTLEERLDQRRNPYQMMKGYGKIPKSAILVDDFMTTGRTLNHAASVLKNAGVIRVHAFSLGVRVLKALSL